MHFPGFNVGAGAKESAHEVNMEVCCVPGFQVLQWLPVTHKLEIAPPDENADQVT